MVESMLSVLYILYFIVSYVCKLTQLCFCWTIFIDVELPKIHSCPTNLTQNTDVRKSTAMFVWEAGIVTDNSGEDIIVECDPSTGSIFNLGQTEVTCEAVDSSGNIATCSFTVNNNNGKSIAQGVHKVSKPI